MRRGPLTSEEILKLNPVNLLDGLNAALKRLQFRHPGSKLIRFLFEEGLGDWYADFYVPNLPDWNSARNAEVGNYIILAQEIEDFLREKGVDIKVMVFSDKELDNLWSKSKEERELEKSLRQLSRR
jgi:hypothetical protein